MEVLALLIFAHAMADYPLQGDFLARAKNHTSPICGVPWYHALAAHCTIHAGFVGIITGSLALGIAEFFIHAATDYAKCSGRISYNTDQAIHVGCKICWAVLVVA
ncbi:DUF3307 domain-containing protein [Parasedimentitalea huanghaiensis]|nr:DUF3307 domain-containing protein [Zongyanglinia huanghaiensis]